MDDEARAVIRKRVQAEADKAATAERARRRALGAAACAREDAWAALHLPERRMLRTHGEWLVVDALQYESHPVRGDQSRPSKPPKSTPKPAPPRA
jgi:hypothetical protein